MSSTFDSLLRLDSSAFVLEFGESVVYRPRNGDDGSLDRSIKASIFRNPEARPYELQQGITPSMEIVVRNDSTYGIAISELDSGGDRILMKLQLDDSATTPILLPKPDTQDAGVLTFRIGKRK